MAHIAEFTCQVKNKCRSIRGEFFQDKVAVVTGSSSGIGKEIARQLIVRGAKVVINGRKSEILNETFDELSSLASDKRNVSRFCGDVSESTDCLQMLKHANDRFGQVDLLINNAGCSMEGELDRISPFVFEQTINVNYLGSVYATQAALPFLKQSHGSVLFVSSLAGLYGIPRFSAYSASKMALTALANSLRLEIAQDGVHVGIAYPSFTKNDSRKTILGANGQPIPQPQRGGFTPQRVELVAAKILGMAEHRTPELTFTWLGKLTSVLNRHFPRLFRMILGWAYARRYGSSPHIIPKTGDKKTAA